MGGATAIGLTKACAAEITVTARHQSTLNKYKEYNISTSLSNTEAIKGADIIVLAVKPWLLEGVVNEIIPHINADSQIIVSMAPGVSPEEFCSWFNSAGCKPQIAYVIPNTAIEVGQSMTFIIPVNMNDENCNKLKAIFSKAGSAMVIEQRLLGAATSLASCGIAYAFRYIRAAAEGGVELGFFAKDATQIVAQTVMGAAVMIQEHASHPEAEIDKVTTPGGLTIKGLNAMEEAGFTNAVIKGLKANQK